MCFDFRQQVLGQILADFGDDPLLHVGVEGAAQVGARARNCSEWTSVVRRLCV
jgi:hypothetical protein